MRYEPRAMCGRHSVAYTARFAASLAAGLLAIKTDESAGSASPANRAPYSFFASSFPFQTSPK